MEVMQGPRFKKLPSKARQQLLESCGAVLRNAGEAMQEQITKSLPSLGGDFGAYQPCSLSALCIPQPTHLLHHM